MPRRRLVPPLLVALLAVGAAGCGGDPEEEFLDSFRDDAAAVAFVVDGAVPEGSRSPRECPTIARAASAGCSPGRTTTSPAGTT